MKILFIFHTSVPDGGASRSGLNLVKGLLKKGHDVAAFLPKKEGLYFELKELGIPLLVSQFYWAYPRYYSTIKSAIRYIPDYIFQSFSNNIAKRKLLDFATKFKPDLIHSNSSVIDIGFSVAKELKIPHITHIREFGFKDCTATMWHIKKMLNGPLSYSICITKCIQNYRPQTMTERSMVIYNGMYNASEACFIKKKQNYILYVGGLYKQKGIEDLLRAYGELCRSNTTHIPSLWIAGDTERIGSPYFNTLKAICESEHISDKVVWLGKRNDVSELMRHALVLIVPSFNEAFGRVTAEAMFNGCLVIGRDRTGTKEQFDNGFCTVGEEIGLRFNTTKELCDRLGEVVKTGIDAYFPMIERGMMCAKNLYSNESYIDNTIAYYNRIISNI